MNTTYCYCMLMTFRKEILVGAHMQVSFSVGQSETVNLSTETQRVHIMGLDSGHMFDRYRRERHY